VQLLAERVSEEQMAWPDAATRHGQALVGRPSRAAVKFIADHFGFDTESFDWPEFLARNPDTDRSMTDYRERWRETFYCMRRTRQTGR
jgi:hypothetical protein